MISLDAVGPDTFAPLIGQPFQLASGAGARVQAELALAEVKRLGHRRADAPRDPFSLLFRGLPGLHLPQGIHRLEHASLGALEIFITQIGDGPQGSLFEAVFT